MKSALLLLAVASGGCANNDLSLSILQVSAVSTPTCTAPATIGSTQVSNGLLDTQAGLGYRAALLIRNNLQSRIPAAGGIEYNAIQVEGVFVTLELPANAAAALTKDEKSFQWPAAAGRLDPAALSGVFVQPIPSQIVMKLDSFAASGDLTVIAEMRPFGKQGGSDITGGAYRYPIQLCHGCLHTDAVPACPLPKVTVISSGCFFWQDNGATCCNAGGGLLCGSQAPISAM
jgi:hypothetical protein